MLAIARYYRRDTALDFIEIDTRILLGDTRYSAYKIVLIGALMVTQCRQEREELGFDPRCRGTAKPRHPRQYVASTFDNGIFSPP